MSKQRLVSGIQPTGQMHLGNYLGAIQNWVELQDTYDSFFMIVDLHALTTVYEDPKQLRIDKLNLAIDLLAAGVDPKKACLFYQSDVRAHSELHLILSMMTPLPWLERVPSYKGKITEMADKDLNTYGFLGYPLLQAADIMLYEGDVVPVGKDQLPHLELTREVIRRFNHFYKSSFPEPEDRLTSFATLLGVDGRKMSKSYNNTIPISLSESDMTKRLMGMMTDPARVRRTDPGNPDVCPVYNYHQIYTDKKRCQEIDSGCRSAELGCVVCKQECAGTIVASLSDFRERRAYYETHLSEVNTMLKEGAIRANEVAENTMGRVRELVGL